MLADEPPEIRFEPLSIASQIAALARRHRRVRALGEARARSAARGAGRKDQEAIVIHALAIAYLHRLEFDEAEPLIERATELADESGSAFSRGNALAVRGSLELHRCNYAGGRGGLRRRARALRRDRQRAARGVDDAEPRPRRRRAGRPRARARSCCATPSARSRASATAASSARRSVRSRRCSSSWAGSRRRSGSRSRRARPSGPRIACRSRRRRSRSRRSAPRRAATRRRRRSSARRSKGSSSSASVRPSAQALESAIDFFRDARARRRGRALRGAARGALAEQHRADRLSRRLVGRLADHRRGPLEARERVAQRLGAQRPLAVGQVLLLVAVRVRDVAEMDVERRAGLDARRRSPRAPPRTRRRR